MSIRAKLFGTALLALSGAAVVSAPSSALASNPAANYAVPTKLEFFPDESKATSVVIHGAFFFYQNGGSYGTPSCGYMYFSCPAGSETMCRMQWTDIKNAIGQPQCVGFGPQNMVSKATLRSEGTTPANPDTWDLGIGVSPGSFVGGQCAPAQALKCPLPPPPDMATPPPAPDMTVVPPPNPPGPGTNSGCSMGGAEGVVGGVGLLFASAVTAVLRRRRRR